MKAPAILPSKFNESNITFEKSKDFDTSTTKVVFVKYNKEFFYFQTPIATAPFGSSHCYEKTDASEMSIDLADPSTSGVEGTETLPSQEVLNTRIKEFQEAIARLETRIFEYVYQERNSLLPGKEIDNPDVVRKYFYTPIIKSGVSKTTGTVYAKKFRAKFGTYLNKAGEKNFRVFDRFQKEVDWYSEPDVMYPHLAGWSTKGMLVQMVVQCTGLWITSGKVSCAFRVAQLRFWPRVQTDFGFDTADEICVVPAQIENAENGADSDSGSGHEETFDDPEEIKDSLSKSDESGSDE